MFSFHRFFAVTVWNKMLTNDSKFYLNPLLVYSAKKTPCINSCKMISIGSNRMKYNNNIGF